MNKQEIQDFIAKRAAMEMQDGFLVNLGIGIPTFIPQFIPPDISVILQSENGIIGTGVVTSENENRRYYTNAGGKPAIAAIGGSYIDSFTSFSLIRGGHVDLTVIGALQVDSEGSIASWVVPGKKMMGMGGAMDLVAGARRIIVTMEHTARGAHKILGKCTLPLTGASCVSMIITEMGVMEITSQGIILKEINPIFTADEVKNATGARLIIPDSLKPMA